jgi:hypothetical protein
LNLYVYVGNNPLEYIDPTGHVKETPEQETVEKGAVGEVNNVDSFCWAWVLSLPAMMAVPP